MKKNIIFIIIAMWLSLFLGCTKNNQTSEITTIKLFSLNWLSGKTLTRELADEFEKTHPNIKVQVEEAPWDSFFQNIEIKLKSQQPDIDFTIVDIPMMASYAARGFLEEIEQYIPKERFQESIAPNTYKDIVWNNKLYVAPLQNSAQYMYINKTLFDKYNVDLPPVYADKNTDITPEFAKQWTDQAWTWEEVLRAAQKLTKDENNDGITDTYGLLIEQAARLYQLQPLGGSLGGKIVSPDGLQVKGYFDAPEWKKAITFYGDLFNKYKVSNKAALNNFEHSQDFYNGKVAMFIGGEWNVKRIDTTNFELVIAGHPYWQGGKITTPTGSWTVGLVKNSSTEKKAAATKFIEWWTLSKEGTEKWFNILGQIPANKYMIDKINNDAKYSQFPENANRLGIYQVLHTAEGRPITPYYPIINDGFEKAFGDALQGKEPEKALIDAVNITEKKLERLK